MQKKKILLVGESWASSATHYKGFDQFGSVTFHVGAEEFIASLKDSEYELDYMPAHEAVEKFPFTLADMQRYSVIILSDIGANSFLLHPDVWLKGKTVTNRLKLLRDWTEQGGGLVMVGGYFSFQGIDGKARWHKTPVEQALPVECLPYDDRLEIPEGFVPQITAPEHEIFAGISGEWPFLLGANEVVAKANPDVEILAKLPDDHGGHPLLVTGTCGEGRTVAWTSDMSPHWLPEAFMKWDGYARLWKNILKWASAAH